MKYIKPPDFKSVREFKAHYEKVEREITELLVGDGSASTAKELNEKLSQALSAATSYLANVNRRFSKDELPTAFKEGKDSIKDPPKVSAKEVSETLEKQGFKYAKNGFSRDTYIELQTATQAAGNGLKTRVNSIIKDLSKTGQDSVYNVQRAIAKDLQDHGIFTVEYSNGAKQSLLAYAAMAARSARIESTNIGAIGGALQAGTDLVKMTTMPQCCKLCGAYQGKVYSISGKDKRFPALFKTVLRNGYALPHPNCRHEFIPYFEEIEDPADVEKAIERSRIKYDSKGELVDVRFQKDIKGYAAWQAGNRQLNREALEYDQMKAYYAGREDEMPYKSLGAFRRARRANDLSPAFKMWKYRKRDQAQYEDWKSKIGATNMPESVDKFQEIKYNNQKEFAILKNAVSDVEIREKIGTDEYPTSIQADKQGKHIQGHKNFIEGRSYLSVTSVEEGQKFADYLIRTYSGKGRIVRDKHGKWTHKEIIETEELIGFLKDSDGKWKPTNKATIHYAKDGTHIVPA